MKLILFSIIFCLYLQNSFAEEDGTKKNITTITANEESQKNNELRLNFKRVSLDFSNTTVKNAQEYQDSPYTALNANDETIMKGTADIALELERMMYRWDNRVYANYGKSSVTDNSDGTKTTSETADELIFTSDYSMKLWRFKNTDLGPFASVAYQTEFTRDGDAPRNEIIRGKFGIKLFNNKYFDDLYFANVGEFELTYGPTISKYGLEIGANANYKLKNDIIFKFNGYYRDYISYSQYNPNDLEYDLNFSIRMDVKITKILSLSPFYNFRQAKARGAKSYAQNSNIGISILYSDLFNL